MYGNNAIFHREYFYVGVRAWYALFPEEIAHTYPRLPPYIKFGAWSPTYFVGRCACMKW